MIGLGTMIKVANFMGKEKKLFLMVHFPLGIAI